MVLKESFFKIEGKLPSVDGVHYRIVLDPGHAIYAAHFPDNPITPGVCLIGIVRELAEEAAGCKLLLKEAVNVKFLQPVNPYIYTHIEVGITLRQTGNTLWKVTAGILKDQTTLARMSLVLTQG